MKPFPPSPVLGFVLAVAVVTFVGGCSSQFTGEYRNEMVLTDDGWTLEVALVSGQTVYILNIGDGTYFHESMMTFAETEQPVATFPVDEGQFAYFVPGAIYTVAGRVTRTDQVKEETWHYVEVHSVRRTEKSEA